MDSTKEFRQPCYLCGGYSETPIKEIYGYPLCSAFTSKLGLLSDHTIRKHINSYDIRKLNASSKRSYEEEVEFKLNYLDKEYIKKRIKLLHIQMRIKELL